MISIEGFVDIFYFNHFFKNKSKSRINLMVYFK
jgi:hypothetical protein